MKKEIKFRAITREGIMIYNIGAIEFFTTGSYRINEEIPIGADKLMQFTGLKDKNGKEIYEGDIVKYYKWEDNYDIADIKFGDCEINHEYGCWGYYRNNKHKDILELGREKDYEVIGNIYENPELTTNK